MECHTVITQARGIVSQLGTFFACKFREMLCVLVAQVCQVLAVERALFGVRSMPCFIGCSAPGTSLFGWTKSGLFSGDAVHACFAISCWRIALGTHPNLSLLGVTQFYYRIAQRISRISGATYICACWTLCIGVWNYELLCGLGNQQNLENFPIPTPLCNGIQYVEYVDAIAVC